MACAQFHSAAGSGLWPFLGGAGALSGPTRTARGRALAQHRVGPMPESGLYWRFPIGVLAPEVPTDEGATHYC